MRVPHSAILERLAEAGATADFDRQVIRLPPTWIAGGRKRGAHGSQAPRCSGRPGEVQRPPSGGFWPGASILGRKGAGGAGQGACLERLAIDIEMMGALRRTRLGLGQVFAPGRNLAVNDESLALGMDMIERVGTGATLWG